MPYQNISPRIYPVDDMHKDTSNVHQGLMAVPNPRSTKADCITDDVLAERLRLWLRLHFKARGSFVSCVRSGTISSRSSRGFIGRDRGGMEGHGDR